MWESFVFDKYWKISIQWDTKGLLNWELSLFYLYIKDKETLKTLNSKFQDSWDIFIKVFIKNYIDEELAKLWDF